MQVPLDFICEHGMPQPWATCTDCMLLPRDEQPIPIRPKPAPEPPKPKRSSASRSSRSTSSGGRTRAPKAPRPSTRLPRSVDDEFPKLFGACDLAYEIPDDNAYFHMHSADNDWVAITSFPKRLRAEGWLYLQVDDQVVARCRVRGIGYREKRWSQEPSEQTADLGPGPTIELREQTWERFRRDLGPEGEAEVSGYRYLETDADDRVSVAGEEDEATATAEDAPTETD